MKTKYDVVILGAGHNGLVAAAYLARANLSVLVLEKNDYIGGASTSQKVFPDFDARLSRYSYLVSLFPEKIIHDLELDIDLRTRTTDSFTPYAKNGRNEGLLISNVSDEISRKSIKQLTGSTKEFDQLQRFYSLSRTFAEKVWDSMLEPLIAKDELERDFSVDKIHREAWRSLVEEPLGVAVERYLSDDLLRGVVFTDAKIGVLTHPHDPTLLQNRCFLYHLIGNETGDWKVPVGGMGHVAHELEKAARKRGAKILTRVEIQSLDLESNIKNVVFECDGKSHSVDATFLLVNFGPNVLSQYTKRSWQADATDEGSVFKINMLLHRLPRLKSQNYSSIDAFCGTFHCDEGYEEMKLSHAEASSGKLPDRPPCEVYCQTLTDDSILAPQLRTQGYQTLTLFGIDTPWSLFADDNASACEQAQQKFLSGMNKWLGEPLEDCLAVAKDGTLCIESKSPVDIEDSLGMYHGNIFHNALTFPFAATPDQEGSWGVETEFENVFFCGSAAQRGGAVSGIPGHNAACQVLEIIYPNI